MRFLNFISSTRRQETVESLLTSLERILRGSLSGYRTCEQVCHVTRVIWYAIHSRFLRDPSGDLSYVTRAEELFAESVERLKEVDIDRLPPKQKAHVERMIYNIAYRVRKLGILSDPELGSATKTERLDQLNQDILSTHSARVEHPQVATSASR